MRKLRYPPDQDGYGFTDPTEAVMVQLDGGPPRVRSDVLNGVVTLQASWTLDREKYEYFRSFYRVVMGQDAGKFLCDLIIDESGLTEHDVIFIPGSMKLLSQKGHTYVVGCSLVVTPIPMDIEYEGSYMDLIDIYGSAANAQEILNLLYELNNINLAAI